MLNEKNIKYFAINGEDREVANLLGQHESSVSPIPTKLFDRREYAYTMNGSSRLGRLDEEPQLQINQFYAKNTNAAEEGKLSTEERIQSKNWIVKVKMSYTSYFWTDSKGARKSNYSYVTLLFVTSEAKRIIMNYHKGDSIMVEGRLESLPVVNPNDPSSTINMNYIAVESFLCNAGQTIRKKAQSKLVGIPVKKSYRSLDDVFNDSSLTKDQMVEIARKVLLKNELAKKQSTSNQAPAEQDSQSQSRSEGGESNGKTANEPSQNPSYGYQDSPQNAYNHQRSRHYNNYGGDNRNNKRVVSKNSIKRQYERLANQASQGFEENNGQDQRVYAEINRQPNVNDLDPKSFSPNSNY